MKRVALYVRVSTEEQRDNGLSVDSQIEALEQYCKDNRYKIYDIYNDAGISARKSYNKRPALLRLIEDCKENKIDLILFTKLDRWFRSVADYYDVQRVLDKYGIKWRCIWEDYETETSAGVFKVNIMLSVAQSEADRTSERIKKVFEYKKSKGEVCSGGVGLGYKIENKKWVRDETTAHYAEALFNTYLSTFSLQTTSNTLREMGHPLAKNTIRNILSNPAYYKGLNYVDYAYITEDQHNTIIKARKKYVRKHKRDYIFSGLCICGLCGYKMTAESTIRKNKNGTTVSYFRYMCNHHNESPALCYGASCREDVLEEFLLNNIESELNNYNLKISAHKNIDTTAKIDNNKAKIQRIKDLYELGDISLEEYKEKRDNLLKEIDELSSISHQKIIEFPKDWKEAYNSLDNAHKNAFWISTLDHIEVTERLAKNFNIFF